MVRGNEEFSEMFEDIRMRGINRDTLFQMWKHAYALGVQSCEADYGEGYDDAMADLGRQQ